jgi:hypothetical protein
MNYTKEQFEKLPKWAQREIKRLEQNVGHYKEKAMQVSGEAETNTLIVSGIENQNLPKNSRVMFRTEKGYVTIHVEDDGTIDVHANPYDKYNLAFLPRVSNRAIIAFVTS